MNRASKDSTELSPKTRALFESLLQVAATSPSQRITRRKATGPVPLSFAQQRLWFLDQLEPGNPVYNILRAFRLTGPLDVATLEKCLNEIVRRHEALRTTFTTVDGQPVQVITPTLTLRQAQGRLLPLAMIDLSDLPETERGAQVQQFAIKEGRRGFDLAQGPLLRTTLLRLGEQEHVFLLVMHHIVSDGWSISVFFRELATLYDAFSMGKPSPLSELPIQYTDFAVWEREWLQGEALETQLAYWRQQLDGSPPILELPTDYPRCAVQTYRGAFQSLRLSKSLIEALKTLSQQEGTTLFMTLLAAFKILLQRYSGQDDIVVGTPIASRNQAEIEGTIGCFLNTLVLRTNLSGSLTFRELLARVRAVTLGAYKYQSFPFEKLVQELQSDRDLSHHPLFQVFVNMFNFENTPFTLPGLTAEAFFPFEPASRFDLTLYLKEQDEGIDLELVYSADLFSPERMTYLLQQFRYLLEQIVAAPERPIHAYSLVTAENRSLLPDLSIELTEPQQESVTSMVAAWAKRMPTHLAIRQGQQSWTYGELTECADTLARVLRAKGLEQGDVVAVYGRQSFGLIVGMLGVLSSGGVLLPIDRHLPDQRKQLMLQEATAKNLVYVGSNRLAEEWLKQSPELEILFVEADTGRPVNVETGLDPEAILLPELSPDDPAYIFFTSGTTGVPKGVLGCHKSLSHFLNWQRKTFAIGPQDRSAQLTSLSFDVVLRDIFLPLTSGATLCLPEDIDNLGPDDIVPWLEWEQISTMHAVPTLAQAWLANVSAEVSLPAMLWVFFAGEPLTDTLVRQWRAILPRGKIVNLYGPTETTMAKCFYQVPADVLPGIQPIGWPLPQTQALVLAENNRLCGIGEAGEIVIRTPFRTLGYINATEENRKRFVKNPFRDDERDLLYCTGDRGRYRPDGMLEILGRLDDQVKIRGVRVEPDEVATTLARHPAVQACTVIARQDEGDQTYLAAYVVPAGQDEVTIPKLRSYLSSQLPAAMVPAAFVFLDQLPLTPNGKVDRRALPVPDRASPEMETTFVAPRTPVEETVAGIWAELLGVEQIGIHHNLFELGGHSLLATQIMSRLRWVFGVELPLRSIFETPTVAGLVELIETICWAVQGPQHSRDATTGNREEGEL